MVVSMRSERLSRLVVVGGVALGALAAPAALARPLPGASAQRRTAVESSHRTTPQAASALAARVRSKAALIVSFDGRKVHYQKDASEVRSIASLSKLMAVLVIAEKGLKPEEVITISQSDAQVASGGCRTRLLKGMKVKNIDLLHAALLASDNRAIPAMGRAVGLGPAALVSAMNARAKHMGLVHTRFLDPVGINPGNVSTAYEVAKIMRAAALHPLLQRVMRTREYYFSPVWPKQKTINYYNTNVLVHRLRYPVYGGKTGFNSQAGYCFTSALRLPPLGPVLAVFLGSTSKAQRYADFFSVMSHLPGVRPDPPSTAVARRGAARPAKANPTATRRPAAAQPRLYASDED
jgi:D-alanyl-D-alanine endopeptidase (penicillin-binding protein 7)